MRIKTPKKIAKVFFKTLGAFFGVLEYFFNLRTPLLEYLGSQHKLGLFEGAVFASSVIFLGLYVSPDVPDIRKLIEKVTDLEDQRTAQS